jgi:hypothetical protein
MNRDSEAMKRARGADQIASTWSGDAPRHRPQPAAGPLQTKRVCTEPAVIGSR